MVVFPNCKINLGLFVCNKRADGYHDLDTVFYPLPLRDAAEIVHTGENAGEHFELNVSGFDLHIPARDNLVYKAWQLLREEHPNMLPMKMFLHKAIPSGAGLGGGSSDAAFTLKLIADLNHLDVSHDQLIKLALRLGSDCPFFLINKPCSAAGRGERLTELQLDLSGYTFVLVHPGIHINTGWAFNELARYRDERGLQAQTSACAHLVARPLETWRDNLVNDFELPIFETHPILSDIKNVLYRRGAVYASMTGTGSSIYGIFKNGEIKFPELENSYKIHYLKGSL